MGTPGVVGDEVGVEVGLHLVDALVELGAAHDAEVLVEERAVQALDVAVGLRAAHLGGAVLDLLELQEQLVGMAVGPAAELAAVVREHGGDPGAQGLEGRDHVVVHDVHGGDRQLGGVQPPPGIAGEAVDDGLQIDFADALQVADEEGVHGDQVAGVPGLDLAFAELGAETLEQPDLLVGQVELLARDVLLQAHQALVPGQEVVAAPDPAHAARRDLDALQHQFVGDPQRAVAGVLQGVVENGPLDIPGYPVGVRPARAGQPVDQPRRPVGLEVAPDLVELLARIAHQLAGLGHVVQVRRQFEQGELASCYLVLRGHVVLL